MGDLELGGVDETKIDSFSEKSSLENDSLSEEVSAAEPAHEAATEEPTEEATEAAADEGEKKE